MPCRCHAEGTRCRWCPYHAVRQVSHSARAGSKPSTTCVGVMAGARVAEAVEGGARAHTIWRCCLRCWRVSQWWQVVMPSVMTRRRQAQTGTALSELPSPSLSCKDKLNVAGKPECGMQSLTVQGRKEMRHHSTSCQGTARWSCSQASCCTVRNRSSCRTRSRNHHSMPFRTNSLHRQCRSLRLLFQGSCSAQVCSKPSAHLQHATYLPPSSH